MSDPQLLRLAGEGLLLALLVSAPPLIASLLVSLVMGALQGATQIQDSTLSAVPRLVVVVLTLVAFGPTIGGQLVRFTKALLLAVPTLR